MKQTLSKVIIVPIAFIFLLGINFGCSGGTSSSSASNNSSSNTVTGSAK